ncbi:ABC transporter permease [Trueperella bialowiezensis]|uniref:ABC-2 type transporter n=1 Tax=Trueperella bialowiezensis TaxID=312285 RepID=A0A3S4VUD5_9ACTO|nr:ABC transporter permease [Trueperella bialowiezensis]VEI13897.1 Uncharacterised protein [Trueperella bialowiezensis]
MLRQLRLTGFHVAEFAKVPYFVFLMVTSTLSMLAVQAIALYAWDADPWVAWVRSAIVGMWTTTTAAAGILGFERFKGTLVHLVTARINVFQPLTAVVSAASLFGLLAFGVSWAAWDLVTIGSDVGHGVAPVSAGTFLLFVFLLWLACLAISFTIAALFVLTPNAITYEELLVVPVFILSGMLFTSTEAPAFIESLGWLIPITEPISVLLGKTDPNGVALAAGQTLLTTACWLVLAYFLGRVALRRARVAGTLDVI